MDRFQRLAQDVINRRGYIVGTGMEEFRVGEVVTWPSVPEDRFYILAVTDAADYDEQVSLLRQIAPEHSPAPPERYFHRISTD